MGGKSRTISFKTMVASRMENLFSMFISQQAFIRHNKSLSQDTVMSVKFGRFPENIQ